MSNLQRARVSVDLKHLACESHCMPQAGHPVKCTGLAAWSMTEEHLCNLREVVPGW